MSSRNFINSMATIAITESQINVLMRELKGDELEAVLPALIDTKQACDVAFAAWPGQKIDEKGMKRLHKILDAFHGSVSTLEMVEYTSTALVLLESLRAKLAIRKADKRRITAIENLIEKMVVVHEHFDPGINNLIAYYRSAELDQKWQSIVEAA